MKEIDSMAINQLGIPEIVLMENAGIRTFESINDNYGTPGTASVVCGKGNNGGDAAVVARHLMNSGCEVMLFLIGKAEDAKPSAKINFEICKKLGIKIKEVTGENDVGILKEGLTRSQVIIDGIFGTGLERDVEGIYLTAIESINKIRDTSKCKVVAIDIPSGLDSDTGQIKGACVDADLTITLHLPKVGMLQYPALFKIGKLVIADIGIPYDKSEILNPKSEINPKLKIPNVIDVGYVKSCLPQRKVDANKGDNGRVMIIAGSKGMSGAAVMAGKAALRAGAGLVYLSVSKEIQNPVNVSIPEVITWIDPSLSKILSSKLTAVGVGPGIGDDRKNMVERLIRSELKCPLIIDADALNAISNNPAVLLKRKCPVITTPHPGEMARLLKTTAAKVQEDRVNIALKAAKDWNVIVVLKGAYTVIASPSGQHFINITGNPGLATAGTGDVLTGIICSLAGQGVEPFRAAVCACFVHGMCGDVVALNKGQSGMIASDIIEAIPFVINSIVKAL